MDFIEELPPSKGKNSILVIVDRITKYAHFVALTHPFTPIIMAQVYLDHVYKLHGLPYTIVSDRDRIYSLVHFGKNYLRNSKPSYS